MALCCGWWDHRFRNEGLTCSCDDTKGTTWFCPVAPPCLAGVQLLFNEQDADTHKPTNIIPTLPALFSLVFLEYFYHVVLSYADLCSHQSNFRPTEIYFHGPNCPLTAPGDRFNKTAWRDAFSVDPLEVALPTHQEPSRTCLCTCLCLWSRRPEWGCSCLLLVWESCRSFHIPLSICI